jgi:hypothetical protein
MGLTPNVVDGNIILAAWGNETRDRARQVFANRAAMDTEWPDAPDGATAYTTDHALTWERNAGAWVLVSRWTHALKQTWADGSYGDSGWTWPFTDSTVWPVESIARITAVTWTTGWQVGIVPTVDVYTNNYASPWIGGFGMPYSRSTGQPFTADQLGNAADPSPQQMPPVIGSELIPANNGIVWTLRVTFHPQAGAVFWQGGYSVVLERLPNQ